MYLSGKAAGDYALFTLPEKYRQSYSYAVGFMAGSGSAYCGRVIVSASGDVRAETIRTLTGFDSTVVYMV